MEKLKFYIKNENELNEYERENKRISYKRLINYLFTDLILCNDIEKLFNAEINGEYNEILPEIGADYDSERDEYAEIYQYFIVDFPAFNYDFMKKYCNDEIILYYSDLLDLYILGVDHLGTSWDYVLTGFEYTTDYENSMQGQLYKD